MKPFTQTSGYMPPKRENSELSYKRAFQILNQHFTLQCAISSKYTNQQLNQCLTYLPVENTYAESGLQNLACTQKAPSADTFLRRESKLYHGKQPTTSIAAAWAHLFSGHSYVFFRRSRVSSSAVATNTE